MLFHDLHGAPQVGGFHVVRRPNVQRTDLDDRQCLGAVHVHMCGFVVVEPDLNLKPVAVVDSYHERITYPDGFGKEENATSLRLPTGQAIRNSTKRTRHETNTSFETSASKWFGALEAPGCQSKTGGSLVAVTDEAAIITGRLKPQLEQW